MPLISMIVFFNRDFIPHQEQSNMHMLRTTMESGIERLKHDFPELKIGQRIPISCAVAVQVKDSRLADVVEFLESTKIGTCEFDGMMIAAARGGGE